MTIPAHELMMKLPAKELKQYSSQSADDDDDDIYYKPKLVTCNYLYVVRQ